MRETLGTIGRGLAGFGAGVQNPNFAFDLQQRRQEQLEKRRMEREKERQEQLKQMALGKIAPIAAQKYNLPQEDVLSMMQGGISPSVLGTLMQEPEQELVEVYDPELGGMTLVPQKQALGRLTTAPTSKERRIIEQDGVQYYVDTGEPVIESPTRELGDLTPKELKEVSVPGLEIAEGATPTKDDAKKIKTIKQAKTQLDKLVNSYQDLVEKYGYEPSFTKGGKLIRQKKAQIDLQAKNLEELGALQEADREILGDMLGDPTGFTSPFNAQEVALMQIDDYKNYLTDRYSSALETRGYKPKSSMEFKNANDVKSAFNAGKLTKDKALSILKNNFGYE